MELSTDPGEYLVALAPGISLGDGIVSLTSVGFEVLSCSEERSEVESAFLRVTDGSKEEYDH